MRFQKDNDNPTYANPLTIVRENRRFETCRLNDGQVAFSDRKPRKGSKYWTDNYIVWDLVENRLARQNRNQKRC